MLCGGVFDSKRNVAVMFGGASGATVLNETWEYDGTDWTNKTGVISGAAPSARIAFGSVAFDAKRNVTVLFGGWNLTRYFNDSWEYDGASWQNITEFSDTLATAGEFGGI